MSIPSFVYADATFTYSITETYPDGTKAERTEKVLVKGSVLATITPDEKTEIIDPDRHAIVYIDYRNRTYRTSDFNELRTQLLETEEILRAQFADSRLGKERLADLMHHEDPTREQPLNIKTDDTQKDIGAFSCRRMTIATPLRSIEAWVSESVPGREELARVMNLLYALDTETPFLSDALAAEAKIFEAGQFPVLYITELIGSGEKPYREERLLTAYDQKPLAIDTFKPPTDFTEAITPQA